jgi:hypothetical protein
MASINPCPAQPPNVVCAACGAVQSLCL